VLAVCAFHFGVPGTAGGFLGVDVFYVLSGYLITGLLVREVAGTGSLRLGRFWARRARRLLPALLVVLVAVTAFVRYVALPGTYPGYAGDALAALCYVSNWHQIATATDYFVATGPPSPLTHTWSLAIEEQFYLVWPVVVVAVLRLVRPLRRGLAALLGLAVAGAVASQVWMLHGSLAGWSTTRLYFGTDTHAMSVLVGAALAVAPDVLGGWGPWWERAGARALLGPAALGVVAGAVVGLDGSSTLLFRGGFLGVALLVAVVLAALAGRPGSTLARVLAVRPLAWLGLVSYGVYLWHVPVRVALTPARVHLGGAPLVLADLAVSVGLAAATYSLVERPVLRGAFWRHGRAVGVAAVGLAVVSAFVVDPGIASAGGPPPVVAHVRGRASEPREVVVLGDSTALTLAVALRATVPAGVRLVDGSLAGCGLSVSVSAGLPRVSWCNQATPAAGRWPAVDARTVAATGPGDQVLFLAGHWETSQTVFAGGRSANITQPAFRRYELHQLETLYSVATAHGAHLDLLTMAPADSGLPLGLPPAPADSARRRDLYDGLLRQLARLHPRQVSVIDFGAMLAPSGRFQLDVDGVQVRAADGVHTPSYVPGNLIAGDTDDAALADRFYDWVGPRLWPLIDRPPATRA
jgi:peptidoglycan/LPS O-acetylase OafA/YrhL